MDIAWVQKTFPDLSNFASIKTGGQKHVLGCDHPTEGAVVLKLYKDSTDSERMVREIQAAKKLACYRVPEVFDTGTIQDALGEVLWIREARIQGSTLSEVIASRALAPNEVLKLGLQMLETLSVAESERIVHRDVKPDNILLDVKGDFWLLDFGFSRHLDQPGLTRASLLYGPCTPGYAPIEQFRNHQSEIDGRADLFALAVTLYECYYRVNPFRNGASGFQEILTRVENQDLPKMFMPCDRQSDFADLVGCMAKRRRDQRPNTVAEAYKWFQDIVR